MGAETNIEWANHTGGPYLGCSPVSPGCVNCYSWEMALTRLMPIFRRAYKAAGFADWETRPVWGDRATRVLTKGFWKDARRLNAAHAKAGTRGRWFPSLIDWLDEMPGGIIDQEGNHLERVAVLADLLALIQETQNLDWLLLTKRPGNWRARMEAAKEYTGQDAFYSSHEGSGQVSVWLSNWIEGRPPANVWMGCTVEDQVRADERVPLLLGIPARVRFQSCEPLLGAVDLNSIGTMNEGEYDALAGDWRTYPVNGRILTTAPMGKVDWVIAGGESGAHARPSHPEWFRALRDQCAAAGAAFFFKQWGEWCGGEDADLLLMEGYEFRGELHDWGNDCESYHFGKKTAGRLLDGREWNDVPAPGGGRER